jgi:hypothetical protein
MTDTPRVYGPAWDAPPAPAPPPTITLHPNLARLAERYQRICGRVQRQELDPAGANREMRDLIARDDQGLAWSINPADGGWLYWSRAGTWVPGQPPAYGLATLTAHDLTGGRSRAANPDDALTLRAYTAADGTLEGSTRRAAAASRTSRPPRWLWPALVAVGVAVALFVAAAAIDRTTPDPPLAPPPTMPVGT